MSIYKFITDLLHEMESKEEDIIWEKYLNEKEKPIYKINKVLVVPYLELNGKIKLLTVLNKKFNQWGFICGTIERKETYLQAAKRELYEETKKMIDIDIKNINYNSFDIYEDFEHFYKMHKRRFTVVLINISDHKQVINNIEMSFEKIEIKGREYNENQRVQFKTAEELYVNRRTWPLIKTIVKRSEFQRIVG